MLPQAALAAASTVLLLALTLALSQRQRALLAANASLEARVAERTAALAENERFLRLAQQAAGAASWSWRPDTGEVRVSPELFRLLGLEPPSEEPTHFGGFMDVVHPDDLERLRQAHQTALREGAMQVEVRVFRRMPGGGREERWLLCRARRFGGGVGEPVVVSGVDLDITERRRAEERFEAAAAAMEGFVYETDLGTGRVRHTAGVATLLGEAVEGTTAAWLRRVHAEDLPRLEAEMRPVTAPHGPERYAVEYRVRRADGGWLWLLDRGRAFRDPDTGAATRLVGGAVDITGRRLAEERQALLMREVDHRAKNALAVVSAALRLTRGDDVESYRAAVESRVAALARAQAILADSNWLGTDLREVVRQCLAPFLGEAAPEGRGGEAAPEGRAVLEGPQVTLAASATQPLSMALHELATNATKYGALSCPEGRLRVAWRLEGGRLVLRWEETGGPEVAPEPARRGFGTRVIDSTVRSQLSGEAVLDWRREGLAAEFSLPAERTLSRG
jgi:PAS domain S-box-containing protein